VRLALAGFVIILAGLGVGALLGAIGQSLGPAGVIGIPLSLLAIAVAFHYPTVGTGLVLASIPFGLKVLPVGFVVIQGVAMLAVLATVLRRLTAGRAPLAWSPVLWWGLGVLLIAFIATPRAPSATLAVKQDVDLTLGLLLVLSILAAGLSFDQIRRLVHVLLVVGAGICLYSLRHIGQLRSIAHAQHVDNRLHGAFTEPNQFGGFCAIVFVVALGATFGARTRRSRYLCATAALIALIPLVLTLSRGAWLGTSLALLVLATLLPHARRRLLAVSLPVLVALPLLGVLLPESPEVHIVADRFATLTHPKADPYDARPAIWAEAIREIEASPWLGHGPGQFPVVSEQATSVSSTVFALHAHDVLLTVSAEIGVPAALLVIGFTISMFVVLRRLLRRLPRGPDQALLAGLAAALAILVGQGSVDFELRNADIFLLFSVLVGLALAAVRWAAGQSPASDTPPSARQPTGPRG
jgi:O-antigen ligase